MIVKVTKTSSNIVATVGSQKWASITFHKNSFILVVYDVYGVGAIEVELNSL